MPKTNDNLFLNTALKEWAVVCDALLTGEQIIIFRKGGIRENNGRFTTEAEKFLLFPTYEHQKQDHIKEGCNFSFVNTPPENNILLKGWSEIDSTYSVMNEREIIGIQSCHIFNDRYLSQRFDFNPYDPVTIMILRVHQFHNPVSVPILPEYLGCRSWITLKEEILCRHSSPVLSTSEFDAMKKQISDGLFKV